MTTLASCSTTATESETDVSHALMQVSTNARIPLLIVRADPNSDKLSEAQILWSNRATEQMLCTDTTVLKDSTLATYISKDLILNPQRETHVHAEVRSATGIMRQWDINVQPAYQDLYRVAFMEIHHSRELADTTDSRLSIVLERSPVPTMLSESGLRLAYVNDAMCSLFGATSEELIGRGWLDYLGEARTDVLSAVQRLFAGEDAETEIIINNSEDGERITNMRLTTLTRPGEPTCFIGTFVDVTDARKFEEVLNYQSRHDVLTGLPNRILLSEEMAKKLDVDEPNMAVYFVDLDGFKDVNDTLGHAAGDELIAELAQRLKQSVRPGDLVTRWGGDEFIVLCANITSDKAAVAAGRRMLSAVSENFILRGQNMSPTMSVGVVRADATSTPDSLLRDADVAMYQAKNTGKNRVALFDVAQRASVRDDWQLVNDLRIALADGDIQVHYQPIVALSNSDNYSAVEALVRWTHPVHGFVSPAKFCALAEANGMANELGEYVIKEVGLQMRAWLDNDPELAPDKISINVSPLQLHSTRLLHIFRNMLGLHNLDAARISVELTETALMENAEIAYAVLSGLREMGIHVSIDDFGTGHSSLSHLSKLPIDCIKIDKSFVDQLVEGNEVILNAVVSLAKALNLLTVAEGVEDEKTAQRLREIGCHLAQGWNYAKSMSAPDYITWKRSISE